MRAAFSNMGRLWDIPSGVESRIFLSMCLISLSLISIITGVSAANSTTSSPTNSRSTSPGSEFSSGKGSSYSAYLSTISRLNSTTTLQSASQSRMKCSVCSSQSPIGMTQEEIAATGSVGSDCATNPKKYMKDCNEWRNNLPSDKAGSINKTVSFTGCYKTEFTYDYDPSDPEKKDEQVVVRMCGFLGKPGCAKAPGYGSTQIICFCTEPECNSGQKHFSSILVITALSLLTIKLI